MGQRVASATTNGTLAESYGYDALGRRVWISDWATTNWMVYAGPHLVAEVDAAGSLKKSYSYGPGIDNLLAMTVHGASSTNRYFYLTDHLGSVHAIVDENGDVIETMRYDAWGRTSVYDAEGNKLSESAIGNRFGFQGREISWRTRLMYFRARYYDCHTGRWLSKDPIGISGGLNQYQAMGNNPCNFRDPWGLWWWDNDWIELGIGGLFGFHGREVAGAGWSKVDEGAAATADGFIPFFDPFENYYADECGNVDKIYQGSRVMGSLSRDALLAAGNAAIAGRILQSSGVAATTGERLLLNQVWAGQLISETAPIAVSTAVNVGSAVVRVSSAVETGRGIHDLVNK